MQFQEKILIRTPNWLGDLIMATGFIEAVLQQFPESQVDLIVKKGLELLPLPCRGKVIAFDRSIHSAHAFGKKLRDSEYQRCYILPPSFSAAWMAFISHIPERIGYAGEGRSYCLSVAKKSKFPARSIHITQEYLALLEGNLQSQDYPPQLHLSTNWIETHLSSLEKQLHTKIPEKFIALAPGAIYGPAKQWPVKHFRRLAHQIHETFQIPILILGTSKEQEMGEFIHAEHSEIINWCGKTSLVELLALLTQCSLLISNDSGSMHLMSALQGKQIAIFGSTSSTWTAPINANAQILHHHLSCSPCFKKTCKWGHYACLQDITPDEVLERAQLLSPLS